MQTYTFKIQFPDESAARQTQLVASLKDALDAENDVEKTEIHRTNKDSQDSDTILTIILAAPAVVAAVKAMHGWAVRSNQAGFVFENAKGDKLIATNLDSGEVPKVIQALENIVQVE